MHMVLPSVYQQPRVQFTLLHLTARIIIKVLYYDTESLYRALYGTTSKQIPPYLRFFLAPLQTRLFLQ